MVRPDWEQVVPVGAEVCEVGCAAKALEHCEENKSIFEAASWLDWCDLMSSLPSIRVLNAEVMLCREQDSCRLLLVTTGIATAGTGLREGRR